MTHINRKQKQYKQAILIQNALLPIFVRSFKTAISDVEVCTALSNFIDIQCTSKTKTIITLITRLLF